MYIELSKIKKHLNIDDYFTDDDEYLLSLEEVAETVVSKHIDCNLSELLEDGALPAPLLQAMLLFVGDMYQSRESVSFTTAKEVPFSYEYLLSLYKNYSKKDNNGGIFG